MARRQHGRSHEDGQRHNGVHKNDARNGRTDNPLDGLQPAAGAGYVAGAARDLSDDERRGHRRVAWHHHDLGPILLEVESREGLWRPVECTIVDLGGGGMGLLAAEPLDPGARVRVTFPLPVQLTEGELVAAGEHSPWSVTGEVVHTRPTPTRIHSHVPEAAHRPHHHGVRFHQPDQEGEVRLLNALYGPVPEGWSIERYETRSAKNGQGAHGAAGPGATTRYAVLREGKRVARGFTSYDRARGRAWSIHMDEQVLAARAARGRPRGAADDRRQQAKS